MSGTTGRTVPALSGRQWVGVLSTWMVSRILVVLVARRHPIMATDIDYYWKSAHGHSLLAGMPEYPFPIALILMVPARLMSLFTYRIVFVLAVAIVDLSVTVMLARRFGHRAVMVWIVYVLCLGPVAYLRFDMFVTATVAFVLIWGSRRPWLSGLAAATGAAIKLWPAAFGAGLDGPLRRRAEHAVSTAVGILAWVGVTTWLAGWGRVVSPISWQSGRGFEFEAPVSSVLGITRALGDHSIRFSKRHGSQEYVGPLADRLHPLVHIIEYAGFIVVLGLMLLTLRRVRPRLVMRQAALTVTAVVGTLVVTSPVLSPQYLMWLGPGLAVGAAVRAPRALAPLALGAAVLTQVEFPFTYKVLFHNPTWDIVPASVIAVRDALLIALVVIAVMACVRGPGHEERAGLPGRSDRAVTRRPRPTTPHTG